jgi:hypothetical protein
MKRPIPIQLRERGGRSKYRNVRVTVDGIVFHSKKEANRFCELKTLEKSGLIGNLTLQPRMTVNVNGKFICAYIADFSYQEHFVGVSRKVIEDVKSPASKTPVYRLKKKLVEAIYGIEIREV